MNKVTSFNIHQRHLFRLNCYKTMKQIPMMIVGIRAPANSNPGFTPFVKNLPRIDCHAGLGAFAITVSPPPVTAPATTAYLEASAKFGTSVAR